jgi:hypothetical protein
MLHLYSISFSVMDFNVTPGIFISVPKIGAGRCLGPEGNGFSLGEGGEGVKQSVLSEGRDNMGKDKEDRASRT